MKNLLLILVAISFFNCKKDNKVNNNATENKKSVELYQDLAIAENYSPAPLIANERNLRSTNNFYHVGARCNPYYVTGYTGLAFEVPVKRLNVGGDKIKSIWTAAWYNVTFPDGTGELRWVQWGYAVSKDWGLIPALYIYHWPSSGSGGGVLGGLNIVYAANPPALAYSTAPVRFSFEQVEGTWFAFKRNNQEVLRIDMQTTSFDGTSEIFTESWGSPNFATELHVNYFDYQKNNVWNHIPYGDGQSPDLWNIQGQKQIPSFIPSEITVGGRQTPAGQYILWNTIN